MPILKQTVFVLGAGSNTNYGFPLGIGLRDLVCRSLSGSQVRTPLLELGHSEADIETLLNELRYSGYTSVDVFLEHNPDFLAIGKHAIAATLLPCEDERRLFPPEVDSNNHWYEYLINRMGVGTDEWTQNKLSVVTFNYDRSFEHYFNVVIGKRAKLSSAEAYKVFQQVPLVHVHGSLGNYPPSESRGLAYGADVTAENVAAAAEQILVVSEVEDTLPTFEQAEKLLLAAEHIYFIGFGFLLANVRRLRIFDQTWRRTDTRPVIKGTTFGFTDREWQHVEQNVLRDRWNDEPRRSGPMGYLRHHAELD